MFVHLKALSKSPWLEILILYRWSPEGKRRERSDSGGGDRGENIDMQTEI